MARDKTTRSEDDDDAFARHAQEDAALAEPVEDQAQGPQGLTTLGKVFIFMIFPLTIGVLGLYTSYLESRRKPDKTLSFDQDFMVPFLLALAMAVVIGIQTGGFTTNKVKPLIAWPKVRRVKKIVRKKKGEVAEDKDEVDKKND